MSSYHSSNHKSVWHPQSYKFERPEKINRPEKDIRNLLVGRRVLECVA